MATFDAHQMSSHTTLVSGRELNIKRVELTTRPVHDVQVDPADLDQYFVDFR